ncbi:Dual specificity testis-specific protein kinase 2 [Sciurus carolinensis]|uniref:Dual specificity testis-specific protein kinase 2 n=1 Tax=Sciurus carolinensis TaxID=30640 RepID=A0AA41T580_SCICA|nr:Dual specificity testis-specific protein kinase 2 [Sciurus carolinensis]
MAVAFWSSLPIASRKGLQLCPGPPLPGQEFLHQEACPFMCHEESLSDGHPPPLSSLKYKVREILPFGVAAPAHEAMDCFNSQKENGFGPKPQETSPCCRNASEERKVEEVRPRNLTAVPYFASSIDLQIQGEQNE